jgi:hypothetical protein
MCTLGATGNDHNFNVICGFTVVIGTCVRENPLAGWVQWLTSFPW